MAGTRSRLLPALGLALVLPVAAWAQTPPATPSPGDAAPPSEEIPPEATEPAPARPGSTEVPALPSEQPGKVTGVVLRGLDKITARTTVIEVPLDGMATFGTLTIRVRQCVEAPPDEKPESAAFLEITDTPPGQSPVVAFSGWMYASSPALSALEHPVYDVWVIDCKMVAPGKP
ncbi:DUF2155 domain-containing protein [Zavarzinia sp.]|uniref:DUF2155 domain-containing protein n=1 Tax=Zavarzinia sp. TaxID=2027920 RepID=UPI003568C744